MSFHSDGHARLFPLFFHQWRRSLASSGFFLAAGFSIFVLSIWFLFIYAFAARNYASFSPYFQGIAWVVMVSAPLLSMNSWHMDGVKTGGGLLLSFPYTAAQLSWTKWLASLSQYVIILTGMLVLPLLLLPLGNFDVGAFWAQILGAILLGALSLAMCQFFSHLFSGYIAGMLVSLAAMSFAVIFFQQLSLLEVSTCLGGLFRFLSFPEHMRAFSYGVIDSADVQFFVWGIVFWVQADVFLAHDRRWSGR